MGPEMAQVFLLLRPFFAADLNFRSTEILDRPVRPSVLCHDPTHFFGLPILIFSPRNICARVIILRQRHGQGDWRDQRCAWACQVYIPLYVHTLAFFNGLSTLMSSVALSFRCRCGKAGAVEIQAPYSGARRAQRIDQARPKPRRASSFCCGVGPRGVERPPNACFEGTTVNTF